MTQPVLIHSNAVICSIVFNLRFGVSRLPLSQLLKAKCKNSSTRIRILSLRSFLKKEFLPVFYLSVTKNVTGWRR